MTISVIMSTCVKEQPQYLDAALKSVWTDQTRKPDEIVLVKDGQLTHQLDIIITEWKEIIGGALAVVSESERKGLGSALNDAITVASGELLVRMDSDDISHPQRFELQEKYMKEHPDVEILGGYISEFDDSETEEHTRIYPTTMDQVLATVHRMSPVGHPAVMFRRSFFDKGFLYNCNPNDYEDLRLWFDALCSGIVINNIPRVILYFRRNDSTIARRRIRAWNEFVTYNQGIYRLNGLFTTKYFYSVARLLFRLMPRCIIRYVYNSEWFRNRLAEI